MSRSLIQSERRSWPEQFAPKPHEGIELRCEACGADWWIHFDLAGFRKRCDCGAWVAVPPDPRVPASMRAALRAYAALRQLRARRTARPPALPAPVARPAAVASPMPVTRAKSEPRIGRERLKLAAFCCLLALPAVGLVLARENGLFAEQGLQGALGQPLVALFAGLVVLATGLFSNRYTAAGLRGSSPRYLAEGVVTGFAAAALALGWTRWIGSVEMPDWMAAVGSQPLAWPAAIRDELGYGWALILAALVPAVFEELAFRGLLQGRATAVIGRQGGVFLTGAAFGLAHGIGLALPVMVLFGLHLGSLRERSQSVLPGVIEHFLFASMLVLLV